MNLTMKHHKLSIHDFCGVKGCIIPIASTTQAKILTRGTLISFIDNSSVTCRALGRTYIVLDCNRLELTPSRQVMVYRAYQRHPNP